jgi:hypothetical protein
MAKVKDAAQPVLPVQPLPATVDPGTAPHPAPRPETQAEELDRLRRENEILRGRLAEPATGLATATGAQRKFRVRMKGLVPLVTALVVEPRPAGPPALNQLPSASFSTLDLFNDGHRDTGLLDEAWRRYAAEHSLTPADRVYFQTWPGGQQVRQQYLDLVAASPAEAAEKFRAYNGVLKSTEVPSVESLDDEGQPPPAAPTPQAGPPPLGPLASPPAA